MRSVNGLISGLNRMSWPSAKLVIEAVFEDPVLKGEVLSRAASVVSKGNGHRNQYLHSSNHPAGGGRSKS